MLKLLRKTAAWSFAILFGLYSIISPLPITVHAAPDTTPQAELIFEVPKFLDQYGGGVDYVTKNEWTLSKTATPSTLNLVHGTTGSVTYTVTATKVSKSEFSVTFFVNIEYPTQTYDGNVIFDLDAVISNPSGSIVFQTKSLENDYVLLEGGKLAKNYTATFSLAGPISDYTPMKIAVTLTPSNSSTPETTKSAAITFKSAPTAIYDSSIQVSDDQFIANPSLAYDWIFSATGSQSYSKTFASGTVGVPYYNTNNVTGLGSDGFIPTPAQATVTVNTLKANGETLNVTGFSGVYDSQEHSISVNNLIAGDVVYYSLNNTSWSTVKPMITNVTGGTTIYVKVENPNYNDRTGNASVVITPRPITITANSATKVYDGLALTNSGYALSLGTLADGEVFGLVTVTGSQTNVGSSANIASAAVINNGSTNVAGNYAITYVPGTLTVTKGTGATLSIDNYNAVYDSAAHSINVNNVISGDVVYYSLTNNGSDWATTKPMFTNVTLITTVYVKVVNSNYEDRLGSGTVTITVRPITITADSNSKVYNGLPLTDSGYTLTLGELATGDSFFSVTVTGSRTNVGSSDNIASAAVIKDGGVDVSANYAVTYVKGTLTVTKATGEILNISNYNDIYDSEAHSISVLNLIDGDVVFYSLNNVDWELTKPLFTNVTSAQTVYVKVSNDNYDDRTGTGTVTITARPITIKANNDTKVYDGTPLSNNGYTLTLGTLATGETFGSVTVIGSQTNVGSSSNLASAAVINDGSTNVAGNYAITYLPGTLTVTKGTGALLSIDNYNAVYDSSEHSINVTNTVAGDAVYYSLTNNGSDWTTTKPMFTNVTTITTVYVKVVNSNYEDRLGSGTVTITVRPITIKANNDSKVFDGTPLTNSGYTLTLGSLATGESIFGVTVTGSQTVVGSSDNIASAAVIKDGEDIVSSNYLVTYAKGTLSVTKAIGQTLDISNYSDVYDSEGHGITLNNLITGDTAYFSLTNNGSDWSLVNPMITNVTTGTTVYVKVVNNDYEDRLGSGTVTITRRPITITADDNTKVYDGIALTDSGYALTLGTLASGESLISVNVAGSQTNVGSSANVASAAVIQDGLVDVSTNYEVSYVNGTLSVTPATGVELDITDYDEVYDSEEHSINIENLIAGDMVYYSLTNDPDDWSTVKPMFTNVTPVTTVYVKVVNPNYLDRLGGGMVTITLRPISIQAGSDSKVFDGAPLTNNTYLLTLGTLAGTETIFGVTVTGSQTNVGNSANTPSAAVVKDGDLDVTSNYEITYVNGTLTVTPATGEELDVIGYDEIYDSEEHGVILNNLIDGDVVYFSLTNNGSDWSLVEPKFTNVSVNTIYVKVMNPNYIDRMGSANVSITLRPISITAGSAAKVADGLPLTNSTYTLSLGTLATGEVLSAVTLTGSQTVVGVSANVASAAVILDGAANVSANYAITYVAGTLTVSAPANVAPTAASVTYTILRGTTLNRAFVIGDADADPLTITILNGPDFGSVTVVNGRFNYVHDGVALTSDTFTFRVSDGTAVSPIRTIRINFTDLPILNNAPVVENAEFDTDYETALDETVGDLGSDIDGDPLTFALVAQAAFGTVTLNADGTFRYVPRDGFEGTDSFTFKANDGKDDSNIATVTINVGEEIFVDPEPTPQAQLPWWWLLGLLPLLLLLIRRPRPEVQEVVLNPDGTVTATWGYLGPRLMHKDYDRDESVLEVVSGDVKQVPPVDAIPYEFDRGRHENIFKTVSDKNAVVRWTIKKKTEELDPELIEKMLKKNQK